MSNGLLYIFDKDEKLLSILNNEASESDIFFDDEFKKELNGEWSYKFSVDMSKTKDIMLEYNKVGFYDSKGNFQLFIIHDIEDNISYDAIRTLYCLHDFQSLNEEILEVGKITGTAGEALQLALKGTKYSVGKVSTTEEQIKDLSMITNLEAVYSIAETYGLELYFRLELDETKTKISKRYVDLVSRLGVDSGLTFDFSLNIESIKRKINNNFFTALYGRGKKLKDDTYANFSEATWVKGENPTNKPQGQLWVADEEAVKKYGLRKGIYSNQNISIANTLLSRTWEKLQKVNRPKVNYEASVYDLSSIVGYENLQVSLGDRFDILDKEYNINESVRVIAEYESILDDTKKKIELGDPITGIVEDAENGNDGTVEDTEEDSDTPQEPDAPGEGENTLPKIPVVSAEGYFATISISWTFENKNYYTYELYASDVKGFTPNENDKIFEGKASAFLHEVEPMEKWYYKVRAKNDYGRYTDFSTEVSAETLKIADGSKYFESASIKDALIGNLSLDRGWVGSLKGNYIDAKQLSVTDGNGKRTLDIDSFGNISGSFEELSQYGNNANKMISLRYGNLRLYSGQFGTDNKFLGAIGQAQAQNTNFGYGNVWGTANMATAKCYFHDFAKDYNVSEDVGQAFSYNPFIRIAYENIHYQDNTTHKAGVHFFQYPVAFHSGADFHSTSIQSLASLSFVNPYSRIFSGGEKLFVGGVQTVIGKTLGYTSISETIVVKDSALVDVNAILDMKNNTIRNVDEITANTITCYNPIIVGASISGRGKQLELYSNDRNFGGVKIDGSTGYFYPSNDNTMACGAWSNKWTEVIATKGVISTSDRNSKENIKYLNEEVKTIDDISVTAKDLYLFIKDDLRLANFDYKGNKSVANKQVGFIAQDIKNTKVGGLVVVKGENGELGYINNSYINIIAGALQYEINIRDKQIKELISKIEVLEKAILNK